MKKSIFTPGCAALLELAIVAMISSDFSAEVLTNEDVQVLTVMRMRELEKEVTSKNKSLAQTAVMGRGNKLTSIELENNQKTYKSIVKLEYVDANPVRTLFITRFMKTREDSHLNEEAGSTVSDEINRIFERTKYYSF